MTNRQEKQARIDQQLRALHGDGDLANSVDLRLMARLWPFLRPHRGLLILAASVILVTATTSLYRPLVMMEAIDEGVMNGDADFLVRAGLLLLGLVVFEQVLAFVQTYAFQVVGARAMASLRRRVFEHLHRLRVSYFDNQPVGRLMTKVTNDVDAILELFSSGALNVVGDLVRLIGIVAIMVQHDWQLSLLTFATTPLVALMVVVVRRFSRTAFREIRARTGHMNATMNEQVSGIALIQAYQRESKAAAEFDEINAAYRDANIRAIKYEAMQDAAIEMVQAICLASIVMSLGVREVSFGTIVAFNTYLFMFFEPISQLAQRYTLLQSALAGAERVFGVIDETSDESQLDAVPAADAAARGDSALAVEFSGVDFAYRPDTPVLRSVSFSAAKGERIALVGPTGAGKSTVASLMLRLHDVQAGVVRINGEDVRGLERSALRSRFSVVPQEVFLFPGTVAENIAAGENLDRDRVRSVLGKMGVLELFESRPGGIDAQVGEEGSQFSTGERQLIAFGRALYRDAPILILDEATASIDSETERHMQGALDALMAGRSSLIIAHRLATIKTADRIVCFQAGRVVEQGSHDELLAAGGLYAKLHHLQFAREDD